MPDSDLYTIGEVAAILGVSAHTIRAWERRHGVVHPQRTRTRQRRYRGEDVELLRDVKRAISLDGLSLKLAVQTVTGGHVSVEARTPLPRSRRSQAWPAMRDEGVWQSVADVLPELILVIDARGKIVEANVASAKVLGAVRQQVVGRSFADLIDPFDRSKGVLLYRPRVRTVKQWELNLRTRDGVRLFSFDSWPVKQAGETRLALVGSEMFKVAPGVSTEPAGDGIQDVAGLLASGAERSAATADTFQSLVDRLPLGVAVTTIGSNPRVVYANQNLSDMLGLASHVMMGRPVDELLRGAAAASSFRMAAATGRPVALRGVAAAGGDSARGQQSYVNIAFQPLSSSSHKVASMLVVVENATAEVAERQELEHLAADARFEQARSARQLGLVGLEHLTKLVPGVDFAIAVAPPPESRGGLTVVPGPARRREPVAEQIAETVRRAAATGESTEVRIAAPRRQLVVTAVPLSTRRRLGVLAWSRPIDRPLTPEQRGIVEAFSARLRAAAELFQARAEAARKTSRLAAVIKAASVVRLPAGRPGLGFQFLRRLADIMHADGAAIGRVEGSDYVVEEAYARGGAHAKPGDRFPLQGAFVSDSVRTGQSTTTERVGSPHLPEAVRKPLARMKHAFAVPIRLHGRLKHVVTLLRADDRPFSEEDVSLVQTLAEVALLSVTVGGDQSAPAETSTC